MGGRKLKKKKKIKSEKLEIIESISLIIFFFGGILLVFKRAYDYTIIKTLLGFLFTLLLSVKYIMEEKNLEFNYSTLFLFILLSSYILFSSFFIATFKYGSASLLENYLLYFLIFILASNLKIRKEWIYYWLISAFISSMIGFFQYLGPKHYAISTFGNPNFFAGHILMPMCIGFSLLFSEDFRDEQKFLSLIFLTFGTITLLFTKSRAAITGLFFGIATVFFILNKGKRIKWAGFLVLFLILGILSPVIYKEFMTNIRYYIWAGTINLIKHRPFTGWGFGQFIFYYFYFRKREYFLQPESTPVTNHAHNEYFEILSELGVIGLFLFLFLIYKILNKYFRKDYKIENKIIAGFIGGIFAVMVDNIFSTNLRNPSTAMYFWFLLGVLNNPNNKKEFSLNFSKLLYSTILFTSFVMSVFYSNYRVLPEVYLKRGIWAKDSKNYKKAIENYEVVCALNPYNYTAWYKLAYVYGMIGNYKKAEKIYLYINRIFPHFAKTDTNLGTVYLKMGNYKEALKYYLFAEWLNPYDKDVLCSIASIYLVYYNNVDEAVKYLKRVLTLDPENRYANKVIKELKKEGKLRGEK